MQVEVCDGAAHCTQIKQEKAGAAFLHISVTKQLSFLGSSERFAPQKHNQGTKQCHHSGTGALLSQHWNLAREEAKVTSE